MKLPLTIILNYCSLIGIRVFMELQIDILLLMAKEFVHNRTNSQWTYSVADIISGKGGIDFDCVQVCRRHQLEFLSLHQ